MYIVTFYCDSFKSDNYAESKTEKKQSINVQNETKNKAKMLRVTTFVISKFKKR